MHPPLPIPSPPAFVVNPTPQAGKAESAQAKEEARAPRPAESQSSAAGTQAAGTQAERAVAAQRALPVDDDDFEEDEQMFNLPWLAVRLCQATLQRNVHERLHQFNTCLLH